MADIAGDHRIRPALAGRGRPQRHRIPEPGAPKRPRPDALIVLPLTFNTGSKWALGMADNRPLSLLCETLGAGKPIIAVPLVNADLWGHPAWPTHLDTLTGAGVVMVDPATGERVARPVNSDDVDDLVRRFDPAWLLDPLHEPLGDLYGPISPV